MLFRSLGFGKSNSNGVKHGQVLNIDETIKAIKAALDDCRLSNPELELNEVYVGIAGHHIKSLQTRGDIVRQQTDEEITQIEIDQLVKDQYKTFIPAGDQIIDVIPQEFTIDNLQNITNPIGYGGVKVGANFHIITGDKNAIRNINRSVEKAGLTTKDLVLQPLASSSAACIFLSHYGRRRGKRLQYQVFGMQSGFFYAAVYIADSIFIAGNDVKISSHFYTAITNWVDRKSVV